jgi:2-keto-4-pentenoate hydratase/2-oxohepta-3-ene-1,7-dioic acid hydratase in catechol pathway
MERPGKLICVGLNYADHAAEAGFDLPTRPIIFSKWTSSMIDNGAPIRIPSFAKQVDWEAELAVVIDRGVSNISEDDALDFVRGYACMNDVTARDIQMQESQWVRSKSFDTFGPFGPRVVPRGEIADPQNLGIRCLVNGEVMQDGSTSDMVFSVASLISHLSQGITLGAGDIIATGTPAGIGLAKQPQRFLTAGDEVTVEIDGVGSISNPVVGPE